MKRLTARASVIVRSTAALIILGATVPPALADQGQITWTTYLYQGPSTRYSVIAELQQASLVDIESCKDGWCEISSEGRRGWIESEVLTRGDPTKPEPGVLAQPAATILVKPAGPCFEVNQKGGNGGNDPTYICAK